MSMRRLWLCVPPTLFALADYAITASEQPAEYWAGEHHLADEANPLVLWCMTQHPAAFHALTVVWIASFCIAIFKLPRVPARLLSLCITFSHAFCGGTWLFLRPNGFFYALTACIACAICWVLFDEMGRDV